MANQPGLTELLKWSVENSDASKNPQAPATTPASNKTSVTARPQSSSDDPTSDTTAVPPSSAPSGAAANALRSLLGGPSDADLMLAAMSCITSSLQPPDPSAPSAADRLTAFHNLEELVEQIDNAHNLAPLGLWTPLLAQLRARDPRLRELAAWTVGTAVQNNAQDQERLVTLGALREIADVAVADTDAKVRKKARRALSCAARNAQVVLDEVIRVAPEEVGLKGVEKSWNAGEMADVDEVISLFEKAGEKGNAS